jgi:glycosyltransferase involved in cell wall biosynthesis
MGTGGLDVSHTDSSGVMMGQLARRNQEVRKYDACLRVLFREFESCLERKQALCQAVQHLENEKKALQVAVDGLRHLLLERDRVVVYWEQVARLFRMRNAEWQRLSELTQDGLRELDRERIRLSELVLEREEFWRCYAGELEKHYDCRYEFELKRRRWMQATWVWRLARWLGLVGATPVLPPLPARPVAPDADGARIPGFSPLHVGGPAPLDLPPCPDSLAFPIQSDFESPKSVIFHAGIDGPTSLITRFSGYRVHVAGWALDADGEPPLRVWVVSGGVAHACSKGSMRPDVVEAFEGRMKVNPACGFCCDLEVGEGVKILEVQAEWTNGEVSTLFKRPVCNLGLVPAPHGQADQDYRTWVALYDSPGEEERQQALSVMASFVYLPRFSVLMPVFNTEPKFLAQAIESVLDQWYPNWELCLVDDASTKAGVREVLLDYAQRDSRIRVRFNEKSRHISGTTNVALSFAEGEYCALLDHDDLLAPQALFRIAERLQEYPNANLIYSDEDKVDPDGNRFDPYFKSDWNPDLLLSHNCISHLGVYRRSVMDELGGFDEALSGSQDWDLALRVATRIPQGSIQHIARVLYHWRYVHTSTAHSIESKPYAVTAAKKAIERHLASFGTASCVESGPWQGAFRVRYPLVRRVSVVIFLAASGPLHDLNRCVNSVLSRTRYNHFELLLLDTGGGDPSIRDYLSEIQKDGRVGVSRVSGSGMLDYCRRARNQLDRHEVAVVLDSACEIVDEDWLEELVSQACRREVGVVGAKVLNPNHSVWHAGMILGAAGVAARAYDGCGEWDIGHMGRAQLIQNYSAVSGVCMATRCECLRSYFDEGNESGFAQFWDLHYCLSLAERFSLRTLWTPYASVVLHERGQELSDLESTYYPLRQDESDRFRERWGAVLDRDPFYNPNLSLESGAFALAWPPRLPHPESVKTGNSVHDYS